MNMAGGGSSAKWATGTSKTIAGLKFKPTQIWVFGYHERSKLRSGTYNVTLNNTTYRWDSFTLAADGTVTRVGGGTGGTGYVTRDGYGDENTGNINTYNPTFQIDVNDDGTYTISTYKPSSSAYNCTPVQWFAMK